MGAKDSTGARMSVVHGTCERRHDEEEARQRRANETPDGTDLDNAASFSSLWFRAKVMVGHLNVRSTGSASEILEHDEVGGLVAGRPLITWRSMRCY
jgi:hypothetical protein